MHEWSSKRDFLTLGKEDGLLYIRYKVGKRHVNQLVVPAVLIQAVLNLKHDHAGHIGAEKTTSLIRREYFWLSMINDVKEYCKSCLACARSHPVPSRPSAPFTVTSSHKSLGKKSQWISRVPLARNPPTMVIAMF